MARLPLLTGCRPPIPSVLRMTGLFTASLSSAAAIYRNVMAQNMTSMNTHAAVVTMRVLMLLFFSAVMVDRESISHDAPIMVVGRFEL